jgi:hypothetical protein
MLQIPLREFEIQGMKRVLLSSPSLIYEKASTGLPGLLVLAPASLRVRLDLKALLQNGYLLFAFELVSEKALHYP